MSVDPRIDAVAAQIGFAFCHAPDVIKDHWRGMASEYLAAADAVDPLRNEPAVVGVSWEAIKAAQRRGTR